MRLNIIVAVDEGGVMGKGNGLPWHISEEMCHFKTTTVGYPVIMGRKTWESIPVHFRPLACRTNIVLSRQPYVAEGAFVVSSFDEAYAIASGLGCAEAFVMGGLEVYKLALASGKVDRIILSLVKGVHEGDVLWPKLNRAEWGEGAVVGCHPDFHVLEYTRKKNELV